MEILPPRLEEYEEIFHTLDTDNSGFVTAGELVTAFKALGIQVDKEYMDYIIRLIDCDADGQLDLQEFQHMMYVFENAEGASDATILFLATDNDYSNTIDKQEFTTIVRKIDNSVGDDEINQAMEKLAINDDGSIPYAVFAAFMSELLGID